ncbi:UNVERIFIED_CONTAM: hypothetical protein HDU68_002135, partial [Siphonaria sp. JEL0065]
MPSSLPATVVFEKRHSEHRKGPKNGGFKPRLPTATIIEVMKAKEAALMAFKNVGLLSLDEKKIEYEKKRSEHEFVVTKRPRVGLPVVPDAERRLSTPVRENIEFEVIGKHHVTVQRSVESNTKSFTWNYESWKLFTRAIKILSGVVSVRSVTETLNNSYIEKIQLHGKSCMFKYIWSPIVAFTCTRFDTELPLVVDKNRR